MTFASGHGYEHFLIASVAPTPLAIFDQRTALHSWPSCWRAEYIANNFLAFDPVVAMSRRSTRAFRWSDVPICSASAKRVMEAASLVGLRQGVSVPYIGFHGYEGTISFSGSHVDDDPNVLPTLELVAYTAANRLASIRSSIAENRATISPREKEVLRWASLGKTSSETASILSTSTETVNKQLSSAMRKLDAVTKTHAVAESLRRGLT